MPNDANPDAQTSAPGFTFDGEFNAERAAALISNLRNEVRELKAQRSSAPVSTPVAAIQAATSGSPSNVDALAAQIAALTQVFQQDRQARLDAEAAAASRAVDAARADAAKSLGINPGLIAGSTVAEIQDSAAALAEFRGASPVRGRPRPAPFMGQVPGDDDNSLPDEVLDKALADLF